MEGEGQVVLTLVSASERLYLQMQFLFDCIPQEVISPASAALVVLLEAACVITAIFFGREKSSLL